MPPIPRNLIPEKNGGIEKKKKLYGNNNVEKAQNKAVSLSICLLP